MGTEEAILNLQLTAVFEKVPEGYVAFVEELPGANTQGATIEEAREDHNAHRCRGLSAEREQTGSPL